MSKMILAIVMVAFSVTCSFSQTWTSVSTGLPSNTINTLFVSGSNLFAGTNGAGPYISTNNGSSWAARNTGVYYNITSFAQNSSYLFVGIANAHACYRTNNNGSSWTAIYTGLNNHHVLSLLVSGENLYAGTDDGVYYSTNNGSNWTYKGLDNNQINDLKFYGSTLIAATDDGIRYTTNGGTAWTGPSFNNNNVECLLIDGTNIYAGVEKHVLVSTNGGANWSDVSSGLPTGIHGSDVRSLEKIGSTFYAATHGDGGVYSSTNPSSGWSTNNTGLSNFDMHILKAKGTDLFSGNHDGVFKLGAGASAPTVTPVVTHVLCNGTSTGEISLTVSGGTSPYGYSWSGSGSGTNPRTALAAGTYNYTVTDANSLSTTGSATITEPASALTVSSMTKTDVICNGGTNGTISLTVSGGTGSYSYLWSGSGTGDNLRTGLVADTYYYTVSDANQCSFTGSVTISEPPALSVSTAQTDVLCNGAATGAISLTVSGGTGSYSYAWSGSGTGDNPRTGLVADTYYYTVSDANQCNITGSVTISEPASALSVTTQAVSSIGTTGATGNGTITSTGGIDADTRGVCWNTTGTPTISDSKAEETGSSYGAESFTESITGLDPNTLYYVRAYANNTCGLAYGNEVTFVTFPNPPTCSASIDVTTSGFTLSWTAPSPAGTESYSYTIEVTTDAGYSTHISGSPFTGETGLSKVISGLNQGTNYYHRIKVVNSQGSSDWCSGSTTTAGTPPPSQGASGISFSNIRKTSIDVRWTPGNGAGSFVVIKKGSSPSSSDMPCDGSTYRSQNRNYLMAPSCGGARIAYFGTGNIVYLTGLTGSTIYYVHVCAYNGSPSAGTACYCRSNCSTNPKSVRTSSAKESGEGIEAIGGTFEISNVYPNPAKDYIEFTIDSQEDGVYNIEIYNEAGDMAVNKTVSISQTSEPQNIKISTENMASGHYSLMVKNGYSFAIARFLIVK